MHSYDHMQKEHGRAVSQTIDSPIMILDFWELGDAFAGLAVVLLLGVIFYEWVLMFVLLAIVLVAGPILRRRNEKGFLFHWPYKHLGISLPGLVNPKGRKTYSD